MRSITWSIIIAWGTFWVGFLSHALLASGKRADEAERRDTISASVPDKLEPKTQRVWEGDYPVRCKPEAACPLLGRGCDGHVCPDDAYEMLGPR